MLQTAAWLPVPHSVENENAAQFNAGHFYNPRSEGLEPPTYKFVACCSIQLSYDRAFRRDDHRRYGVVFSFPAVGRAIRRERDSNPRYDFTSYNGLANRRLQPLGHLSPAAPSGTAHDYTTESGLAPIRFMTSVPSVPSSAVRRRRLLALFATVRNGGREARRYRARVLWARPN